jgi:group II intron reverse transcriptase/maturase
MKDTPGRVDCRQLRLEDFLLPNRPVAEGATGAHSVQAMSERARDGAEINSARAYKLLDYILSPDNILKAAKKVFQNGGSPGVDGMDVGEAMAWIQENMQELIEVVYYGDYVPQPVRRVEIPKPDGAGVRLLGIPSVIDRVIQQAVAQILSPIYEKKFSNSSFGFRPGRSAHQAILQCKEYINAGFTWAVDIDLEKFFDKVCHDKLIRLISQDIDDGRVVSLIRKFLVSGVMINGVVVDTDEGTPQGGPISPLLSNIMLHELDRELERRGLRFCRYADDCNIYVKTQRAANRVMESITKFIEGKLRLKVNQAKSMVDRPWKLKFLGFTFYWSKGECRITLHQKSKLRLKAKLKKLTSRKWSISFTDRSLKIKQSLVGWVNYFKIADMKSFAKETDQWLRRRSRMCIWKTWKKVKTRIKNLRKLGVSHKQSIQWANTRLGYWRVAGSPILSCSITNERLAKRGLVSLLELYEKR